MRFITLSPKNIDKVALELVPEDTSLRLILTNDLINAYNEAAAQGKKKVVNLEKMRGEVEEWKEEIAKQMAEQFADLMGNNPTLRILHDVHLRDVSLDPRGITQGVQVVRITEDAEG